jgi:hypothetical protein
MSEPMKFLLVSFGLVFTFFKKGTEPNNRFDSVWIGSVDWFIFLFLFFEIKLLIAFH